MKVITAFPPRSLKFTLLNQVERLIVMYTTVSVGCSRHGTAVPANETQFTALALVSRPRQLDCGAREGLCVRRDLEGNDRGIIPQGLWKTNEKPYQRILFILIMKVIRSSETSVLTRVTRRRIPENGILTQHSRMAVKSSGTKRTRIVTVQFVPDVSACSRALNGTVTFGGVIVFLWRQDVAEILSRATTNLSDVRFSRSR
jgi:hypothetical protein